MMSKLRVHELIGILIVPSTAEYRSSDYSKMSNCKMIINKDCNLKKRRETALCACVDYQVH